MRYLFAFMMVIVCCGMLTACINITTNNETKQPDGQDEEEEIIGEKDTDIDEGKEEDQNDSVTPDDQPKVYQITLYFTDNDLTDTYRIEREIELRKGESIEKVALESWLSGPGHDNLLGFANTEIRIESVEDIGGIAHVSFSKEIQELNLGSGGEAMLVGQIAMIMQQFGFEQTQILVEGKVIESLLGHVTVDKPIKADNPENYLWVQDMAKHEVALENEAFQVYEPAPHTEVKDRIVVRGLARVFEGNVRYEFEDGHFILDEGFTTASEGAPGWGEFEIIIELDEVSNYSGSVILFEESAKDGSRINELMIPVKVVE